MKDPLPLLPEEGGTSMPFFLYTPLKVSKSYQIEMTASSLLGGRGPSLVINQAICLEFVWS